MKGGNRQQERSLTHDREQHKITSKQIFALVISINKKAFKCYRLNTLYLSKVVPELNGKDPTKQPRSFLPSAFSEPGQTALQSTAGEKKQGPSEERWRRTG